MVLSVIIPALNEKITIAAVISRAQEALQVLGIDGEVIVADNGSLDGTVEIAQKAGARVVHVEVKGYGSALQGGIVASIGDWIIFADADMTYDFGEMRLYIEKLKQGYEFVIGNRYKGCKIANSMPFLHRYLGTPVLTFVCCLLFKLKIGDVNCGMRSFTRKAYDQIGCKAQGMEFASELLARASLAKFRIAEVPCTLNVAPKQRKAHIRAWQDGWRHLMLMFRIYFQG